MRAAQPYLLKVTHPQRPVRGQGRSNVVEQRGARGLVEQHEAVKDGARHIGDRQPADGAAAGARCVPAQKPKLGYWRRART
ncbi:MAG: hypothetical protein ACRDRE_12380, partial [Pseudonocardiaceae bacterium]